MGAIIIIADRCEQELPSHCRESLKAAERTEDLPQGEGTT
jgi:hypothetical protein